MENKLGSMYALAQTFEKAISMVDDDGVLTDEALEMISQTEMNITEKTENIFKVLSFLNGQVDMMKGEKQYIDKKKKVVENNVARLRELMSLGLDTVGIEVDKKGKKSQKIKTLKGSVYYTFKDNFEYNTDEIEDKYIIKKSKFRLSDDFTIEALAEKCPELVIKVDYTEIDYDLLKFDFERDEVKPKGIKVEEIKTLNVRK